MAGNHTLGTIRGTIEIDYDGAGIVKAVRDTNKAKKSLGDLNQASDKTLRGFASFGKGAIAAAGAVSLVTNSASLLAATLAVVGPLASAGFAAAPGVMLAYASAMTVAKIATAGVGDAMAEAAEGGAKFEEAMKKLSPEAQRFVKAYQKALPALKSVQRGMQDAFFQGADQQVTGLVRRLITLRGEATNLAATLGGIAQKIALFVTSGERLESIRKILAGTNAFLRQIGPSLALVAGAFVNLAAKSMAFAGVAGGNVAGALQKLAAWLNQIDVAAIFEKAGPIVAALGTFLGHLATIASELFGIFATDGANAAGVLGELAGQLAAFLQSAEGQAALQALGQAMQAIAGAAGQVFLALLKALAPTIVALAPGLATLAAQIASVLVPALNALAPILASVAQFLSQNMSWLGPVAGAVLALAIAYKTYAAGARAVGVAQDLLKSKLVTSIGAWVRNTAAVVANRVALIAHAIASGTTAVAGWVANTAAMVANRAAIIASTIASNAAKIATIAWTATTYALGVAMRFAMGPIGLIITAIGLITAAIIYLWKNNDTFRNIVTATWNFIKAQAMNLWNGLKAAFNGIKAAWTASVNAIRTVARAVWSAIVTIVRTYINTYRAIILAVVNAVKAVWSASMNAIRAVARAVWSAIVALVRNNINSIKAAIGTIRNVINVVRSAFTNAKNAAQQQLRALLAAVRRIPGQVSSALSGLGNLLYNKGQQLIQGFINGIKAMAGKVASATKGIVSSVTKFLPGSPAKEGPLSGRGYVLLRGRRFMTDFARGIQDQAKRPSEALYGAVAPMARAVAVPASTGNSGCCCGTSGGGGSSRSGGGGRSASPAVPGHVMDLLQDSVRERVYKIGIGGKPLADLVVDVITGRPVAVKKAVDEGARRTAWAGSGR